MNTLFKIAFGAAIAGAVIAVMLKRRAGWLPAIPSTAGMGRRIPPASQIPTLDEVAGEQDEHAVWGGGSSGLSH